MAIEFELKYSASAEQQRGLAEGFPGDCRTISMETTYYDTPDRVLSARRVTLRRRLENGVSVCAVKIPAGSIARGEWELECDDIRDAVGMLCKSGAPEELLEWTAAGIEPICGARFIRKAVLIREPEFTAELALDSGVLLGGGQEIPLGEVELELKSGDPDAMVRYMTSLAEKYGLRPEPNSKFRRAYDLARK